MSIILQKAQLGLQNQTCGTRIQEPDPYRSSRFCTGNCCSQALQMWRISERTCSIVAESNAIRQTLEVRASFSSWIQHSTGFKISQ
ncbi:MAG: hypothetical protein DWI22_19060 [Planctomycetota bacterium]|nr:MAG: hypothetical protein DWI22_19060 [Planctomycetota bacterium]